MRLLPFDYAVRNLGRSPRRLLGIVAGNVLVVLLIVAAAAFVEGMRATLSPSEATRNVIIMGVGSEESLERSEIPATTAGMLQASVRGLRTVNGVPFVSPEVVAALVMRTAPDDPRELRAVIRGFTPAAFLVHPRVEITEGRAPRPGVNEMMAGSLAAEKLGLAEADLAPGRSLWFDGNEWTICGRFRARGTVMDAELWLPLNDLMVAAKRDTVSCVVATLDTADIDDIDAFTKMRVDLEITAISEDQYYAGLLRFYRPVEIMIWITALLVAMSGVLGGLNTLYAAFAARVREIGTLQALGYSRRAIVLSLIQESLLASSIALLLALALAWTLLDGIAISFSMGVFRLSLNSVVLASGAGVGLLLGVVGALPAAWRCLRPPIPEALKSA